MSKGASVADFAAFKRKREHPFDCAVNVEQELYAHSDGRVFTITNWMGRDGSACPKQDAVVAVAGGDDPNKGPWFCLRLAEFGLGPLSLEDWQRMEAAAVGEIATAAGGDAQPLTGDTHETLG